HLPKSTRSPPSTPMGRVRLFVAGAPSCRNDFALFRLLLRGVRNDDAACRLFVSIDMTNHERELQWPSISSERGDLRRPQATDPVEPGGRQLLAAPCPGDHAAVASI